MVEKKHRKSGFSLAEAMVSMLILSIFFAVSSRMITQKPKEEVIVSPHSYFECYKDGSKWYSNVSGGNKTELTTNGTSCTFYPPMNVSVFSIYVFKPGGACSGMIERMENPITISRDSTGRVTISGNDTSIEPVVETYDYSNPSYVLNCGNNYQEESAEEFKSYLELVTPAAKVKNNVGTNYNYNWLVYINW